MKNRMHYAYTVVYICMKMGDSKLAPLVYKADMLKVRLKLSTVDLSVTFQVSFFPETVT